jgi:hypothetical protein
MSDIEPENLEVSPLHKGAKLAVIILSALIILALIALVVGGISTLSRGKAKPAAKPSIFTLAEGARVIAMDSQPGRLILHIRTATGEEIDILDTSDGHLVGQVKATFAK